MSHREKTKLRKTPLYILLTEIQALCLTNTLQFNLYVITMLNPFFFKRQHHRIKAREHYHISSYDFNYIFVIVSRIIKELDEHLFLEEHRIIRLRFIRIRIGSEQG